MEAVIRRQNDWQNMGGLFTLAFIVLEITGARTSFSNIIRTWSHEEYSHAWFIFPLATLIFLNRFQRVHLGGSRVPGVLLATLSTVVMLFAWATTSNTAVVYGAIVGIIGIVWSAVGSQAMRSLLAPLLYLFFMIPLPMALYISTSAQMQLWSSKLGMIFILLFHVPASLDGTIIVLTSARLEVAEACNGLRYLFPLVSFAFLISMLIEDRFWKKAFVLASSIPIAIVLNAARIAMIAVLLERFDIDTSGGPAHAFEGFLVFFVCILMLLAEVWVLIGIGSPRGRFALSRLFVFDSSTLQKLIGFPTPSTLLVAGALALIGSGLIASLPTRAEVMPPRQPLALFPMDFNGWRGIPQALDSEYLDILSPTDYVLADYTNEAAGVTRALNLFIAYYASQRAGKFPHSPQLCIPAGGWSIINQSFVKLPSIDDQPFMINRVIIEKQNMKQLVYYWFEERGRHITSDSSLKLYGLRDALIDNRTDGALVRIVSSIYENDEATADAAAMKLLVDIIPLLRSHVPGKIAPIQLRKSAFSRLDELIVRGKFEANSRHPKS